MWWFNFICFRMFWVCFLGLDNLVIFVGSIMFFMVVKFCINIKFWNINFILVLWSCVCCFLFIVWSGVLFRNILLVLILLSLVSRFSKVDLLEFDVFIMVIDLFGLIWNEIGWRICSEFLFVVIVLVMFLVLII